MNSQSEPEDTFRRTILSASPARLRWMLITKGIELCEALVGVVAPVDREMRVIQLARILNELLDGVNSTNSPLCRHVADLYIFLIHELNRAAVKKEYWRICEIGKVLQIEQETWALASASVA